MNYIKDIKLFNNDELNTLNMIIEIEKGSKKKNELVAPNFDKVECVRKIKYRYPFYYGCFPNTLAGDKDPADAILITKEKHKVLDVIKVQPIAIIKTVDCGEEDNKVICVEGEVKNLEKELKKVMKFLHIYKGRKADMIIDEKIYDVSEALKILKQDENNTKPKAKINSLDIG